MRNYQFEEGLIDLRRAEELIENVDVSPVQEGIPGKSNYSPRTFKRNIYFFIAESSMATGDYNTVIEYMDKAYDANQLRYKDDFLVSTAFYKYMAMRKLGRHDEAIEMVKAIPNGLDII
ncbi:tetratricopeptide repeat protein, partial [Pseudemcibacter sp.]|uniref:tetratricopeptide repeat protein n=1 Tax=Pseudemcibacter sp. TaxID=2943293 RepID=UPI003F6A3AEB